MKMTNQDNPYIKLALALARDGLEKNEEVLRSTVNELWRQLQKDGRGELADYVVCLLNPELSFVPMEEE